MARAGDKSGELVGVLRRASGIRRRLDGVDVEMDRAEVIRFPLQHRFERLEYFATMAVEVLGRTYPTTRDQLILTQQEPYGVIAVINPFNQQR